MAVVFISNPTAPALALPAAAAFNGSEIFALDQTNGGVLSTRGGSITQLATFLGSSGGFISAVHGTANEITATTVSGTTTLSFAANIIIPAPPSGVPLTVDGVANSNTVSVVAPNTSGQSLGVSINAGTTSADYALSIASALGTQFAKIFGDGGLVLSSATGGDKGLGTLNATGIFINGVAVATGTVTSITGTANEIAASASTGAVTLSFPTNGVIIPAPSSDLTSLVVDFFTPSVASDRGATFVGSGAGDARVAISTQTAGNAQLNLDTFGVQNWVLGNVRSDGSFRISSSQTLGSNDRLTIASGGSATLSGGSLTVSGATSGANVLSLSSAGAAASLIAGFQNVLAGAWSLSSQSTDGLALGTDSSATLQLFTNSSTRFTLSAAGGLFAVGATGGDKGLGTLNATGLFVNGVAIGGGATTGTFTGTLTGMTAATTGTLTYVTDGQYVTIYAKAAITGTSNSNAMTMTGVPAIIQPAAQTTQIATLVEDNTSTATGYISTAAGSGTITFNKGLPGGSPLFTTSGTKGLAAGCSFSYPLA
jgi:hypothetical protein